MCVCVQVPHRGAYLNHRWIASSATTYQKVQLILMQYLNQIAIMSTLSDSRLRYNMQYCIVISSIYFCIHRQYVLQCEYYISGTWSYATLHVAMYSNDYMCSVQLKKAQLFSIPVQLITLSCVESSALKIQYASIKRLLACTCSVYTL